MKKLSSITRLAAALGLLLSGCGESTNPVGTALSDSEQNGLALTKPTGNGSKIVFSSDRDSNPFLAHEIYVMNADGSGQTRLTNNPAQDRWPSWSPNGRQIVFIRDGEIYVMNADGSEPTPLTNSSDLIAQHPSWSPNGKQIVFNGFSFGLGNFDLYVINADGTGQTNLTNTATGELWASWSPNGKQIAFYSRDGVFVMNADGTGQTNNLTINNFSFAVTPSWSPNGQQIALLGSRDGLFGIYVMNADGSEPTRLTEKFGSPNWSPNAKQIVFNSSRDRDILVINADGTGQTNLTNSTSLDQSPDWGRGRF